MGRSGQDLFSSRAELRPEESSCEREGDEGDALVWKESGLRINPFFFDGREARTVNRSGSGLFIFQAK
ncbi:hypothetical protein CN425_23740 [Bacillus cereus]|uniref:Uncharacterized protein n=1 Tax=Bacillus cereus TaxID=1396 RepID=A0A2A8PQH4_BACCE|nr:hypothetical protein CN425_23740 [Bacillus cereus]PFI25036.1 hypothetical protein COI75_08020 [Bacillus cereus]